MPNTSGELANIVANVSVDVGKEVARSTSEMAKEILLALLKKAQESHKTKTGKTNVEKLLASGEEIKMADLCKEDLSEFVKKAKPFGITYAVVSEENKDNYTVLFKSSESERVKKVLENILEEKIELDKKEIPKKVSPEREKVLKDIYNIEANENGEMYIIVDPKNPKNFIAIERWGSPNELIPGGFMQHKRTSLYKDGELKRNDYSDLRLISEFKEVKKIQVDGYNWSSEPVQQDIIEKIIEENFKSDKEKMDHNQVIEDTEVNINDENNDSLSERKNLKEKREEIKPMVEAQKIRSESKSKDKEINKDKGSR